jgi:hypothetical protein
LQNDCEAIATRMRSDCKTASKRLQNDCEAIVKRPQSDCETTPKRLQTYCKLQNDCSIADVERLQRDCDCTAFAQGSLSKRPQTFLEATAEQFNREQSDYRAILNRPQRNCKCIAFTKRSQSYCKTTLIFLQCN